MITNDMYYICFVILPYQTLDIMTLMFNKIG